ncbi:MAG: hypothetical protein WKH97_04455 [Casimicrobiaceae bacterium]
MTLKMAVPSFAATTLRMFAPLLIWAVHFLAIYAFTAIACERRFADANWLGVGVVPWTIGGVTLAAAAAALVTIWLALRDVPGRAPRSETSQFLRWMTAAFGALTLLAILWEALPVLLVPVCA